MNIPQVPIAPAGSIQHVPQINKTINALSSSALFGVMQRRSRGLNLWLYGGTFLTSGAGPVKVPNQRVVLTPSTTNYLSADPNGDVQLQTVTAPTGWPGPLASGDSALYELDVGADEITDGTCFLLARSSTGRSGPAGAVGTAGSELWKGRPRWVLVIGDGDSFTPTQYGYTITNSTFFGRAIGWQGGSDYPELVPQVTGFLYYSGPLYSRLRGFEVYLRWGLDAQGASTSHAGQRTFYGLYDSSVGNIGNPEPSSILNSFGVGSDAADDNFYLMHNDASGTATKVLLEDDNSPGVNFPSRTVNRIYELGLWCDEGESGLHYSLADHLGHRTSGFVDTDIPAAGTFLGWVLNGAVGTGAGNVWWNLMQISTNSRY